MAMRWKPKLNRPEDINRIKLNDIRTNPGEYAGFNPNPQPIQMQPVGLDNAEPWRIQYDAGEMQPSYPELDEPVPVSAEDMATLNQLQYRLEEVNAQIAAIDAAYPQLAQRGSEWDIAAKRAEIGDMSAYDSMMSRGSAASGAVSGIENELYNAYKLLYGLNAQNDYEKGAYANQIETALRRADEWSARNPNAKMPPIYADLRARYDAWKAGKENGGTNDLSGTLTVDNADKTINAMTSKLKAKTYSRSDEKALQKWVDDNSNSPYTKAIQDFVSAHTNETVEARKEWEVKKSQAEVAARNWNRNRDIADKKNEWNKLVKAKKPITLFYKLNEYGDPVPKEGV